MKEECLCLYDLFDGELDEYSSSHFQKKYFILRLEEALEVGNNELNDNDGYDYEIDFADHYNFHLKNKIKNYGKYFIENNRFSGKFLFALLLTLEDKKIFKYYFDLYFKHSYMKVSLIYFEKIIELLS